MSAYSLAMLDIDEVAAGHPVALADLANLRADLARAQARAGRMEAFVAAKDKTLRECRSLLGQWNGGMRLACYDYAVATIDAALAALPDAPYPPHDHGREEDELEPPVAAEPADPFVSSVLADQALAERTYGIDQPPEPAHASGLPAHYARAETDRQIGRAHV